MALSLGLEAHVRVLLMNKSLRREGICHLPASLPRRAISAASLVTHRLLVSIGVRGDSQLSQPLAAQCHQEPRLEPFANAPGACPLGLGASAVAPLTGLWRPLLCCGPVFKEGVCLSQVTASEWQGGP